AIARLVRRVKSLQHSVAEGHVDLKRLANIPDRGRSGDPHLRLLETLSSQVSQRASLELGEHALGVRGPRLRRGQHDCSRIVFHYVAQQDAKGGQRSRRERYDDPRNSKLAGKLARVKPARASKTNHREKPRVLAPLN